MVGLDRVRNDRVRYDRVRNDRVRNDHGLEMIGSRRMSQRFHIRRDEHVTKSLRNWLLKGSQNPGSSPSSIADHLLNNPECAKHYEDKKFSILATGQNIYHLSVLECLCIETLKPKLCKQ